MSPGFSAITASEHPPDRASAPCKSQTGQEPSGTSSGSVVPHSVHWRTVGISVFCWRQRVPGQYKGKQKQRLRVKKNFSKGSPGNTATTRPAPLDYASCTSSAEHADQEAYLFVDLRRAAHSAGHLLTHELAIALAHPEDG